MTTSIPDQFTLDALRADIARLLHEDPAEIGDDDNLIDLGLDSIRAMTLVTRWRDAGAALTFAEAAENPTVAHWHALIQRKWQDGQAAG
ncbi:MAG: Isochorismatase [Paracidovorax wautersii]|uniref:Isochorismatase n=1 Tax=Paracidovorax wautersii TaxID=1177982 RepID=A0A7V8JRZ0_9BURK|nr:MAG: Isochorismatase [Paracidovorax wautersii]